MAKNSFFQKWGVLFVLSLATFIMVLDTTMMNVSISALCKDLGTDIGNIQMAITLYTLIIAAFVITGSKIGKIFGQKKVFLFATVLYGIGTTMAAISPNILVLIIGWSIVEGLASAMMMPISFTLISENYTGKDKVIGLSLLTGVGSAGAAIGPIFGGIMTTYFSWRYAFGVEVLIVLLILAFSFVLKNSKPDKKTKMDFAGSFWSIMGLVPLVLTVTLSSTYGFWIPKTDLSFLNISPVFFLFVFGVLSLLFFAFLELKKEKKKKEPLLHVGIFTNRQFLISILIICTLNLVLAGTMFIFPIFLQSLFAYTALDTGVTILPLSISVLAMALFAVNIAEKISSKITIFLGVIVAMVGVYFLKNGISETVSFWSLFPGFATLGAGIGMAFPQISNLALSALGEAKNDEASGITNVIKNLGTSFGTAIFGTLLTTFLFGFLAFNLSTLASEQGLENFDQKGIEEQIKQIDQKELAQKIEELPQEKQVIVNSIIKESFIDSVEKSLMFSEFFLFLLLLLVALLPKKVE